MHFIIPIVCVLLLLTQLDAWKVSKSAQKSAVKSIGSVFAALSLSGMPFSSPPALAFGPTEMEVSIKSYKSVELCNGQKPIMPGQKAMEGLFPVCIEVEADIKNPKATDTLKDVSIYGFVKEASAGNSVLPNNPDFRSDSGQYAMIKKVEPGDSTVKYQFVAAISQNPKNEALPEIIFMKTKAVSYPGGSKFQPLSECEMDPRNCFNGEVDDE